MEQYLVLMVICTGKKVCKYIFNMAIGHRTMEDSIVMSVNTVNAVYIFITLNIFDAI